MPKQKRLTPKQVRFCHEYMLSGNAGSAALQAGYSLANSGRHSRRLLKMTKIKAYLGQLQAEEREKYKPSAERLIYELCLVAFSDAADYMNWGNELREIKMVPENKRKAISEVSVTNNGRAKQVKIRLHNKMEAIRLLGKHFGIFEKPVQITSSQTQNISIETHNHAHAAPALGVGQVKLAPGKGLFLRPPMQQLPMKNDEKAK